MLDSTWALIWVNRDWWPIWVHVTDLTRYQLPALADCWSIILFDALNIEGLETEYRNELTDERLYWALNILISDFDWTLVLYHQFHYLFFLHLSDAPPLADLSWAVLHPVIFSGCWPNIFPVPVNLPAFLFCFSLRIQPMATNYFKCFMQCFKVALNWWAAQSHWNSSAVGSVWLVPNSVGEFCNLEISSSLRGHLPFILGNVRLV